MTRVTQAHLDARSEAILDAARSLFLSRGFAAVTMQDIASEAGISAGAIYRYYPSKDELAHAFFEQCVGGGPATMIRQVAPDAPPAERLEEILYAVREMWLESRGKHIIGELQTSMAAIRQRDDIGLLVHKAREQLYEALTEIIEEGQRAGDLDPSLDSRALAMSLNAFVMGIGLVSIEAGEENLEQQIDPMFEILKEFLSRLGPASADAD